MPTRPTAAKLTNETLQHWSRREGAGVHMGVNIRRRGGNVSVAMLLVLQLVAVGVIAGPLTASTQASVISFGSPGFERTWARTDQPVSFGTVNRTWMWGPGPNSSAIQEPYAEAPGGERTVQYFDKSRMEDNSFRAEAPWDVTNGLLVTEMVTGLMQTGDRETEERTPADVNIAGDPGSHPTYADIDRFGLREKPASKVPFTTWVDANGIVANGPTPPAIVDAAEHVVVPGIDHSVASVFWNFMNSTELVNEDGQLVQDNLFENPFYATGYPITEAYWSEVKIGGTPQAVLWQCFERRCLTFNPLNEPGWQVEAGNVGQHYFEWRTTTRPEPEPEPEPTAPPAATAPVEPTTVVATKPATPTNLRAETMSPSSIKLTWNDASNNESGFRIYSSTGAVVGEIGNNRTSYTVGGLATDKSFCYQVAAWNDAGESAKSSVVCATTQKAIPVAPTNVRSEATSDVAITLTWTDASDNERGFRIYGPTGTPLGRTGANTNSFTVTDLEPNTRYCFWVTAWNDDGESDRASAPCLRTLEEAPGPPKNLAAETLTATSIKLTWDAAAGNPRNYRIYSSGGARIGQVSGSVTSYTITDLNPNALYCYWVTTVYASGESDPTDEVCALTIPGAPTNLSVHVTIWPEDAVLLEWDDDSTGITGYEARGFTYAGDDVTTYPLTISGSDHSVALGWTYANEYDCYRIRAINSSGISDWSDATCWDPDLEPPNGSIFLTFLPVAEPVNYILTWRDSVDNELGFTVWAGSEDESLDDWTRIGVTGPDWWSFELQYFADYDCYRVRAYNDRAFSSWSTRACWPSED